MKEIFLFIENDRPFFVMDNEDYLIEVFMPSPEIGALVHLPDFGYYKIIKMDNIICKWSNIKVYFCDVEKNQQFPSPTDRTVPNTLKGRKVYSTEEMLQMECPLPPESNED